SQDNDPCRVQMELVKERLGAIDAQIESQQQPIGEKELRAVRDGFVGKGLQSDLELLPQQGESLQRRRAFLSTELHRLEKQLSTSEKPNHIIAEHEHSDLSSETEQSCDSDLGNGNSEIDGLYAYPNDDFISDFNNRFIIHNIHLKWNNSLRNIILRYIHQVSQRRGFVYYMSRRAVKFILDIVEE